ncbi:hypothetical protein ACTXT7_013953, partial [Hymenolepis weldensis]
MSDVHVDHCSTGEFNSFTAFNQDFIGQHKVRRFPVVGCLLIAHLTSNERKTRMKAEEPCHLTPQTANTSHDQRAILATTHLGRQYYILRHSMWAD